MIFQFHKGTIKTMSRVLEAAGYEDFNSIKVQLKHRNQRRVRYDKRFQFHKGTIKTLENR